MRIFSDYTKSAYNSSFVAFACCIYSSHNNNFSVRLVFFFLLLFTGDWNNTSLLYSLKCFHSLYGIRYDFCLRKLIQSVILIGISNGVCVHFTVKVVLCIKFKVIFFLNYKTPLFNNVLQ